VLQISLFWSFPRGQREDIAWLRIQTAAKGVNGFVKAMRRQTESQPECETQGDFHPARREIRLIYFPPFVYDVAALRVSNEEHSRAKQTGCSSRSFQSKPRDCSYLFSNPPCQDYIQERSRSPPAYSGD
jgi:hypothetical protein